VEALTSTLVMSVGLLGVAALQSRSLATSFAAAQRGQAALAAADIMARMRTNHVAADLQQAQNYATIRPADNGCRAVHATHTHTPHDCSAQQLAADDLADWKAQVAAQLPAGVGVVCVDDTPGDGTATAPACSGTGHSYAVKIFWSDGAAPTSVIDPGAGASATGRRLMTVLQP
jgi:type IV pilus assembly protein PilV